MSIPAHDCDAYAATVTPGAPQRVCLKCRHIWITPTGDAIRHYRQMAADARAHRHILTDDDYQEAHR